MKKRFTFCLLSILSAFMVFAASCEDDELTGTDPRSLQTSDEDLLAVFFYDSDGTSLGRISHGTNSVTLTAGLTYTLEIKYSEYGWYSQDFSDLTLEYDTEYISLEKCSDDDDDLTFWFVGLAESESARLYACLDDRDQEISVTLVGSED